MAITFIGSNDVGISNGGNSTLDLTTATPAGPSDGDLIVICSSTFGRAGNEGRIGNALSYTEIFDVTNTNRLRIAYKVFAAGETGPVVEGSGNAADGLAVIFSIFRGQNTATPIDVAITSATGSSADPDPAAITPASDDCAIVVFAGSSSDDPNITSPTNYTEIEDRGITETNSASASNAYRILSGGAGASENPGTFTLWTTGAWVAATVAIRPVQAAGQPAAKRMGGVPFANYRSPFSMWRSPLLLPRRPALIGI